MLYFCYKMSAIEAKECGFISKIYKHDSQDQVWKHLESMATNMSFEVNRKYFLIINYKKCKILSLIEILILRASWR